MGFETPINVQENKQKEVLDACWYERFEKIGAFQDFEYLEGDKKFREQQQELFFSEQIRNPKLDYPKLEKFEFKKREEELLDLKRNVINQEKNEIVRRAYRWKINEKIAQVRMLKASKEGDDKRFLRYSNFIYGAPESDIFNYDLECIKEIVKQNEHSDDLRILFAAKRLREELGLDSLKESGISNDFLPNKKRILLEPFQEEQKFNASGIQKEFEYALQELKIEGWEVLIEGNITAISVNQEKKKVRIPEKRKLSGSKLRELIAHEIETHVLRRENGEQSKLKLLGLGLDRYLDGEEGISTYEEQKIGGTDDFAGLDGHFAISLAAGLDGKKRDFREVFNILRDYFFLKNKKDDLQVAWEKSKKDAWNRCVRTFRGTSCESKGVCLTRDIVYREGNINSWIVVKSDPNQDVKFSLGKYDPANPRHIWILKQLGISDSDLDSLD